MSSPALEDHYRRLTAMYASAPINATIPSRVHVGQGRATVSMEVSQRYWHAAGAMHGSLYFKALDDAAFFAASSVVTDAFVLTASFTVELLAKVTAPALRAEGVLEERDGRKLRVAATLFVDDEVVARGNGLFVASKRALVEIPGYRDA